MSRLVGTNYLITAAAGVIFRDGQELILTRAQYRDRRHCVITDEVPAESIPPDHVKVKLTATTQFKHGEHVRVVGAIPANLAQSLSDPDAPAAAQKPPAAAKSGGKSRAAAPAKTPETKPAAEIPPAASTAVDPNAPPAPAAASGGVLGRVAAAAKAAITGA